MRGNICFCRNATERVLDNHDAEGPETEGAWTSATSLTFEPTALAVWVVKHRQLFEK